MLRFLTPNDVAAFMPAGRRFFGSDRRAPLRRALARAGQFGPGQAAGRFFPIACVSLEITQRCNLDCSLCYLSDKAELAHDAPLPVLFDRISMIESHYGWRTAVQISGGDPTLRSIEDLEAICRELARRRMWSCLMTNGIKASREMLVRLRKAGLNDVAFHVDLTQERAGYATEKALNAVRDAYIARARGTGLRVLFNTTVYDGNLGELPMLAEYFKRRARDVALASFQLQADTGRGVLRARDDEVSQASVMGALERGVGARLDFDVAGVGHSDCNRYATALVAGDKALSALSNRALFEEIAPELDAAATRRGAYLWAWPSIWRLARKRPRLAWRAARHAVGLIWRLKGELLRTLPRNLMRGRIGVERVSFLVHNFMDARKLERARCESCVFMVMTERGPLSMCVHNARRDHHLFTPALMETPEGLRWWRADTGELSETPEAPEAMSLEAYLAAAPRKRLKGRLRAAADDRRSKGAAARCDATQNGAAQSDAAQNDAAQTDAAQTDAA